MLKDIEALKNNILSSGFSSLRYRNFLNHESLIAFTDDTSIEEVSIDLIEEIIGNLSPYYRRLYLDGLFASCQVADIAAMSKDKGGSND